MLKHWLLYLRLLLLLKLLLNHLLHLIGIKSTHLAELLNLGLRVAQSSVDS